MLADDERVQRELSGLALRTTWRKSFLKMYGFCGANTMKPLSASCEPNEL